MKKFVAVSILAFLALIFFSPSPAAFGKTVSLVEYQLQADLLVLDHDTTLSLQGSALPEWNMVPMATVSTLFDFPMETNDPYLVRSQRWIRTRNLQAQVKISNFTRLRHYVL